MSQFLTHMELSKSMAAILERPQYLAYQKKKAFLKLSEMSHSLTFCAQWMCLAAPLTLVFTYKNEHLIRRSCTRNVATGKCVNRMFLSNVSRLLRIKES